MATSDSQICVVGRMLPHKGFETAIRASPERVRTIIIGDLSHDDEYYRYLKVVAAGANVSFAGEISSSYKAKLLDESRCLVAASTTKLYDGRTIPQAELLGLVLFEAVSHGCIPVATRIPAFTEVMHDLDLSEFLFPENDAAAARALIEQVMGMSDGARLARLDRARQRVQAHYLWDDYWTRVRVNR